jgi:hypothetical protein
MKNLIIHEFSLRDRNSRRVLPALRQFVPRTTWLCLLLLALWAPRAARAATYYVDYASGADANNGTNTASAWQHCPGDSAAIGTAAGTTILAGDTVNFKGGVVYSTAGISVSHSGAAGSVITFDGTGSSWGTGKAAIDGNYLLNCSAIALNSGVSYITITGFEIRNCGGYADDDPVVIAAANGDYGNSINAVHVPRNGYGIDLTSGSNTNIYLANLFVHRIGIWHHTLGWDGRACGGVGIYAISPQSLTIANCEFTQIGATVLGLYATVDVSNVLMTDCYLHDDIPVWGIDIAPQASGVTFANVVITKTRLVNIWSNWTGTDDDPNGTGTTAPHQNYIFIRANGILCYWTNMTISRCLFLETNRVQIGTGGTATIHANNGASFNAYNNVFCRPWSYDGIVYLNQSPTIGMTQVVRFYNNTVQREMGGMIVAAGNGNGCRFVYTENNLLTDWTNVVANNVMINCDVNSRPTALDYNIYWNPIITNSSNVYVNKNIAIFSGIGGLALPDLQGLGFETHGRYSDPLFTDATNNAPALRDFHPLANSPAIGAGTNLSAYFTTDYAGNPRPPNGNWTIGALLAPSAKFPAAPSLMLFFPGPAIINKGQSSTLNWKCVGATNLNISGIGDVPLQGSTNVSPASTTTYTATALGVGTVKVASITLTVQ